MDTGKSENDTEAFHCTGSDEHHDFVCSPCSSEHRNVSASRYCKDCGNYLCNTCFNQHKRFAAMTLHEVVDITDEAVTLPSGGKGQTLPTLKCTIHRGKLLEMYCREHSDVCCIICMTVKHSSCKGMTYLPTAAQEINVETNVVEVQARMNDLKSKLILLKKEKKIIKDKLVLHVNSGKEVIQDEKQMVHEHFESIEVQLLQEIKETSEKVIRKTETHSEDIDYAIQTLERSEKSLTTGRNNLSNLFITLIQIQHHLKDVCDLHQRVLTDMPNVDQLYFVPNKNLYKQLKGIDSLGKMVTTEKPGSDTGLVSLHYNVDVTAKDEKLMCDISGACILTTGHVVLVDCKNRSIKKLNKSYELLSILHVSAIPWSICTVNSTTVAISLWNEMKVQLVWVQDEMKLCSSFTVSDRCSGIYHKDEKLYVCVGGMKKQEVGFVEIYTLSGIKVSSITCSLRRPRSVVVIDHTIFVADEENGLVEIENKDKATIHGPKDLARGQSLCDGQNGEIFICGMDSNNVFTFSVEDKVFRSILSKQDDIRKPQLLCFHQEKSRLLVGVLNCSFMEVFNINNGYK